MPALKLFISHSSRLDDVEHKYTGKDRNWNLLNNTVKATRRRYGDKLDILVDKNGLYPGDRWEHKLNLWLAECHVAIILFSKRAIEKSDWVKKEAAILSWRAELDPRFLLIPVLLDGETTPENLAKDFFGTLRIDANQCVRGARTAGPIVSALARKLKPEDLPPPYPTPLEIVQASLAMLLSDSMNEMALRAALQALGCTVTADGSENRRRYADTLARKLFEPPAGNPAACFRAFQLGFDPLTPLPARRHAEEMLRHIRSLWVDPRAAACLPLAIRHKNLLGLAGTRTMQGDDVLASCCYTLERYVERAWFGSSLLVQVPLTDVEDVAGARAEIRRRFFGNDVPPDIDATIQDQMINQDPKTIILGVKGLPGARTLPEFRRLVSEYKRLIVVFGLEPGDQATPAPLSAEIRVVEPALDPTNEICAFLAERSAHTFLQQKYGNTP